MRNFKDFNLDLKKVKNNEDVSIASRRFTITVVCVPSFGCTVLIP